MNETELEYLRCCAIDVRIGVVQSVYSAKSGHAGGSLSAVDILTYLYFSRMNIEPGKPDWQHRDRFVLSKGHAAPGLYSVLANRGFFPISDLVGLRKIGSHLQGHPTMIKTPGVDMSTGSLGQGFSAAVGMALCAKLDKSRYRVYVLLGDGEIAEGIVWEAAMFAAHYDLGNLCAIIDNNGMQIDGENHQVMDSSPIDEKFAAFGWNVVSTDAHNFNKLEYAFNQTELVKDRPSIIIAQSIKGKGVSFMENNVDWHSKIPSREQYEEAILVLSAMKKTKKVV